MGLDIRLPIGLLFIALALVLIIFGAASDPGLYARSLHINVNLAWGAVLLVFGIAMLTASLRRPKS
jgi:hypothetical protein